MSTRCFLCILLPLLVPSPTCATAEGDLEPRSISSHATLEGSERGKGSAKIIPSVTQVLHHKQMFALSESLRNLFRDDTLLSIAGLILPSIAKAPTLINDSALLRHKRQTYYLCGVFPNQYYSKTACQTQAVCPNGGRYLNIGCTFSAQCTPFYSGVSTCYNGCCCTVPSPTPPPSTSRFGYCPSGQLSEVRCSGRGQCQGGQTCMTGLCCTTTGNEWNEACGGLTAFGSCNNGACSYGVCTASNYCCECPVGRSGGRCNNGICPSGYTCQSNGFCCPQCPNNVMPFGTCRNGMCGGGRTCRAGNICC